MEEGSPSEEDAAREHLTVLLADDDVAFRRGVREVLVAGGLTVVDEVGGATDAIVAASRLNPDICLIELELPGEGANAIARIAKRSPSTLIVVLSHSARPEDVVGALSRGASGYLLKDGLSGERLAATLRAAHRGEPALSRSLVPHLVDEIRHLSTRRITLPTGQVTLTPREWEVAELLREGNSTAAIADRLGVSPVTVRRHVGLLLRKLGAESREDAVGMIRAHVRR
jgi:two-component system nitrate/nitrite response regulator NarL